MLSLDDNPVVRGFNTLAAMVLSTQITLSLCTDFIGYKKTRKKNDFFNSAPDFVKEFENFM